MDKCTIVSIYLACTSFVLTWQWRLHNQMKRDLHLRSVCYRWCTPPQTAVCPEFPRQRLRDTPSCTALFCRPLQASPPSVCCLQWLVGGWSQSRNISPKSCSHTHWTPEWTAIYTIHIHYLKLNWNNWMYVKRLYAYVLIVQLDFCIIMGLWTQKICLKIARMISLRFRSHFTLVFVLFAAQYNNT